MTKAIPGATKAADWATNSVEYCRRRGSNPLFAYFSTSWKLSKIAFNMLITSRLACHAVAGSFAVSIRFCEVQLSETVRKRLRGKRVNFQTFGDVFSYDSEYREISRYEPSEEARTVLQKLLTLLQSAPLERERFVSHLYQSRKEYRRTCKTAGKSGKQIGRCVISTFRIAESMGFKGDFRQWEDLLRIGD